MKRLLCQVSLMILPNTGRVGVTTCGLCANTLKYKLFDLEKNDWVEIIAKTGMPDFVEGFFSYQHENHDPALSGDAWNRALAHLKSHQ